MRQILEFGLAVVIAIMLLAIFSCQKGQIFKEDARWIGRITAPPLIKVGLSKYLDVPQVEVALTGYFEITSLEGIRIATGKDKNILVSNSGGKIKITPDLAVADTSSTGIRAVKIVPTNDAAIFLGNTRYSGNLIILTTRDGLVSCINEVDIEKYLEGTLGSEMPLSSPRAALEAQAIAARTFALYEIQYHSCDPAPERPFDVYDDERSQVYKGTSGKYSREIVDKTYGRCLVWNNRLIWAFYSSSCGGATEPAWRVFPRAENIPPLGGRNCPFCKYTEDFNWRAIWKKEEIIKKLFPASSHIELKSLKIQEYLPGGHAEKIEIVLEPGGEKILNANEFRNRMNDGDTPRQKKIKSTLFEVHFSGDLLEFVGRGYGHGCGMCQKGAIVIAERGWSSQDILKFYYPQAEIKRIY